MSHGLMSKRKERGADCRQQKEDDEVGRGSRGDGRHTEYSSLNNVGSKPSNLAELA